MYKVRVGSIGSPVPLDLPLNRIEAFTVTAWEEPSK